MLHALFGYAERLEFGDGNPDRVVKAPTALRRQPVILSANEYEQLLIESARDPMLARYVLLLGETGVRCDSEALWLRWEDVDFDGCRLHIGRNHTTKTHQTRVVPLAPRLASALRTHFIAYRFSGSPWLFHHTRPAPLPNPAPVSGGLPARSRPPRSGRSSLPDCTSTTYGIGGLRSGMPKGEARPRFSARPVTRDLRRPRCTST